MSIVPVLQHYGLQGDVDVWGRGDWRKVHAFCHEDRTASAATDGIGYLCRACNTFYPDSTALVMDRENVGFDEAKRFLQGIAGDGDDDVSSAPRAGSHIPGGSRNHVRDRSFLPARRGGRAAARP